jgi:hypothetical protein
MKEIFPSPQPEARALQVIEMHGICYEFQTNLSTSCIKLKKANKKTTVTVRMVIIFLNILRHSLLIRLQCCLHQYKTLKAVATSMAAIVVLTTSKNLKKGFLVVFSGHTFF